MMIGKLVRRFPWLDPRLALEILAMMKEMGARTTEDRAAVMDDIANFSAHVRDAWVAEVAASLRPGSRVLDAGAGECRYRKCFTHCEYKTQDFAQYKGTTTGTLVERWTYGELDYVCDITSLPVEDGFFDAVLCTEVLEHVPRPIAAIKELSRVLAKNGRFFLTAPLGSGLHQQPHHFYGGYTPHFYRQFLAENDLEIRELKPIGGLMRNVAQETYRAGRVLVEKAPAELSTFARFLLNDWIPRYLARFDAQIHVEEFTLGYLMEAVKLK
jgi:ubiquinone/menaquinone biosynthesis C-methylase UbiE